jgi:hypothetical protein
MSKVVYATSRRGVGWVSSTEIATISRNVASTLLAFRPGRTSPTGFRCCTSETCRRINPTNGQCRSAAGSSGRSRSTRLASADAIDDQCLVAYQYDGADIEPVHGGPVRLVIPHLYFWKSPKWLRGLQLTTSDTPGFWEKNGYHMYGDPFREQRFSRDR